MEYERRHRRSQPYITPGQKRRGRHGLPPRLCDQGTGADHTAGPSVFLLVGNLVTGDCRSLLAVPVESRRSQSGRQRLPAPSPERYIRRRSTSCRRFDAKRERAAGPRQRQHHGAVLRCVESSPPRSARPYRAEAYECDLSVLSFDRFIHDNNNTGAVAAAPVQQPGVNPSDTKLIC